MWKPQRFYSEYLLNQPILLTGGGALMGLASIPGAKISIIHGSSLDTCVKESISKTFKNKAVYFNSKSWKSEPDLESLHETIQALESQSPDVIIAIGGGSVIDGAKLCRLFYENPMFVQGESRINQLIFTTRFVAIPTTIGSGAEASSAAVFINNIKNRKEMIVSHDLQPEAVVLDTHFVRNAPIRIIISSGIDALAHIIEGYVSNVDNYVADILAETGFRILYEELGKPNIEEMDFERIQYAGYLGGIVQNHCIVGAAHGIAHQIANDGYSHGDAVALLLSAVIEANAKDKKTRLRYMKLFHNANIVKISVFIEWLNDIIDKVGIGDRRTEIKELLYRKLTSTSFIQNVKDDPGAKGNPVNINQEYLEAVLGEI